MFMLISFTRRVKRYIRSNYHGELILLSGILTILVMTFFSTVVTADGDQRDKALGHYTHDGEVTPLTSSDNIIVDLRGLTPADMEKLYPMSSEAEAAIIHEDLPCPVIVDGVRYEGNQISLFNGKRLYYVIGENGILYAFTTAEGLEQYQSEHSAPASSRYDGEENYFFENVFTPGIVSPF
jgi:hypothetical protein